MSSNLTIFYNRLVTRCMSFSVVVVGVNQAELTNLWRMRKGSASKAKAVQVDEGAVDVLKGPVKEMWQEGDAVK